MHKVSNYIEDKYILQNGMFQTLGSAKIKNIQILQ